MFFLFFTLTYAFKSASGGSKPAAAKNIKQESFKTFNTESDNDLNLKQSIEKPGGLFDGDVLDMYPSAYYKKEDEKEKERHVREALEQSDLIEIEPLEDVLPSYILTEIENSKAQKVQKQKVEKSNFAVKSDIKWATRSKDIFVLKTDMGDVFIELNMKVAPKTAAEIKKLMTDGFYNNMLFFRVISKFLVQTGDPSNTGFGGQMLQAKDEFSKTEKMTRGTVAVANKGYANSQSSQFFILLNDASWLDGKYSIIGRVIEGIEVLDKIKAGNTKTNGLVDKPSRIYAIDWYYNEVQKRMKQKNSAAVKVAPQTGNNGNQDNAANPVTPAAPPPANANNQSNPASQAAPAPAPAP